MKREPVGKRRRSQFWLFTFACNFPGAKHTIFKLMKLKNG